MKTGILNQKLYEKLKSNIENGVYAPGYRFPGELEFARLQGVSRNTLRRVFSRLAADNLISRQWGEGTFVTPKTEQQPPLRYMFLQRGTTPRVNSEHIIPQIFSGIEAARRDANFELDHCTNDYFEQLSMAEIAETIRLRRISGVLWKCSDIRGNEKLYLALKSLNIPVVLLYCNAEDYRVTHWAAIPQNTHDAWCEALRYLSTQGHLRIGTINCANSPLIRQEFSPAEYARVLRELNLDPDPRLIISCELNQQSLETNLHKLLVLPHPPTALLCYSDHWAPLIFLILKKWRIRIPEDIAVMGYCGTPNSAYMNPPLSTVAIDYRAIGSEAIKILQNADSWFYHRNNASTEIPFKPVHFKVIERRSTNRKLADERVVNFFKTNFTPLKPKNTPRSSS